MLLLFVACSALDRTVPTAPKPAGLLSDGAEVFSRVFTDSTGLGPAFNGNACAECHENPAPGGFGDETERHLQPDNCLDRATVLHEFPTPETAVNPVGLRSSNDLFGIGHLDSLTDEDIRTYVEAEPRFLGFIDGFYWYNTPTLNVGPDGRIGRFGRRAQVPTLDEFVRGALQAEMGITPEEIAEDNVTALVEFVRGIQRPRLKVSWAEVPGGGGPPIGEPQICAVTGDFTDGGTVRILACKTGAPPIQDPPFGFRNFTVPPGRARAVGDSVVHPPPHAPPDSTGSVSVGRVLFEFIGCAVCHNPKTEYTDLALHDLGESDICEGNGIGVISGSVVRQGDFRTEPLTGLGLQIRFMHDGASTSLLDAIERHGGEAGFSRANFNHLTDRDNAFRDFGQAAVLAFLRSL